MVHPYFHLYDAIQSLAFPVHEEICYAIRENEECKNRWFPSGKDGDYYRTTNSREYVFRNSLKVKARTTWNTYQIDVYIDEGGWIDISPI